jgi:hypothetical protein
MSWFFHMCVISLFSWTNSQRIGSDEKIKHIGNMIDGWLPHWTHGIELSYTLIGSYACIITFMWFLPLFFLCLLSLCLLLSFLETRYYHFMDNNSYKGVVCIIFISYFSTQYAYPYGFHGGTCFYSMYMCNLPTDEIDISLLPLYLRLSSMYPLTLC